MGAGGGDRRPWEDNGQALVLAGEPSLSFQPVVDLATGRVLGFEALLRWVHPTEGVILPQLLIPWAEANGDIVTLGEWVLAESCRQATGWPASMQLAVNCSIVQLRRQVAAGAVRGALAASGLEPDRLTVEVTEHALSDDAASGELRAVAELGVQLAVDDVGTSGSSVELLRRLAVNTIKIDESIVSGLEAAEGINRMVVETVIELAHSCGMSTVAEGVETAAHAAAVRQFESDAAQGYFFAPPLAGEDARRLANLDDLTFPLEGPGWSNDDDWPFPGIRGESTATGNSLRQPRHARKDGWATGGDEHGVVLDFPGAAASDVPGPLPEGADPGGDAVVE